MRFGILIALACLALGTAHVIAEDNDGARGCWSARWPTSQGNYNEVTRCFLSNGVMRGWYFEGDARLAGDLAGAWHLEYDEKNQAFIVIDDEKWLAENVSPSKIMRLSNCRHAG